MNERALPEAVYKSLTKEIQQEKFGARLGTTTRVLANTDTAIWNLLYFFDSSLCEPKVLDKQRSHRRSTQGERRTNDYNKLVSQMIHGVFGQERHLGGAVQVHDTQSI